MSGRTHTAGEWETDDGQVTEPSAPALPHRLRRRPLARYTWIAVNETERRICGDGAVRSASVAEGMALAGRPAARLLTASDDSGAAMPAGAAAAAWVDHRIRTGEPPARSAHAFELVAATPQEAIDHCLLAHELAGRLRRAGLCTLDRSLAEKIALVETPAAGWRPPAARSALGIADALSESFDVASNLTGRPLRAVAFHRAAGASRFVVAAGKHVARARRLADALWSAGIPCGAVRVSLISPLPTELRPLLERAEAVAVLDDSALAESLEAMLAGEVAGRVRNVTVTADEKLLPELAEIWEVDLARVDWSEPVPVRAAQSVTVGAVPAGPWMGERILDAMAWVGALAPVEMDRPGSAADGVATVRIHRPGVPPAGDAALDLLVAGHPQALVGEAALESVREEGSVLLFSRAATAADVWATLTVPQQETIVRRRLRLQWTALSGSRNAGIAGAVLAATPSLDVLGVEGDPIETLAAGEALSGEDADAVADFRAGAASLVAFDPEGMTAGQAEGERAFRTASSTMSMPAGAPGSRPEAERESIHHFHLTGEGVVSSVDPLHALPLRPAALDAVIASEPGEDGFPLLLLDGEEAERNGARAVPLRTLVDRAVASGEAYPLLRDQVSRFCGLALRVLRDHPASVDFDKIFDRTSLELSRSIDHSAAGKTAFDEELRGLRAALPSEARILGPGPEALFPLYTWTVLGSRRKRREEYAGRIAALISRLREIVGTETARTNDPASTGTLTSTLGASGAAFIDPAALARNLPGTAGTRRVPATRLERVRHTLELLEAFQARIPRLPELFVVTPASRRPPLQEGQRCVIHEDGLRASIGLFDGLARDVLDVVRAVRTADLDVDGNFDEERHGPILDRLEWQSLRADELLLLPPIVVLETARSLRGPALAAFSELLRSGRPVHVLVGKGTEELQPADTWEELSGYDPGLGYLAVAHRESLVLQSNLARCRHLLSGFDRMASFLGPAVALVMLPSLRSPVSPALQLNVALLARITPCFLYDPAGGASWAERFALSFNPAPGDSAPVFDVTYRDDGGEERQLAESFTFAHAAAIDPAYRDHFRVISPEQWLEDQVEIGEYLGLSSRERSRSVPYLWVVAEDRVLARAVMTREIVSGCVDRARAWRILQELAGTDNEYARRAAVEARKEAEGEAAARVDELEQGHRQALAGAREEGAALAVERLVRLFTDPAAAAGLSSPASIVAELPPAPVLPMLHEVATEPEPSVTPAEPEEDEPVLSEEPYIDSFLCTTCNDCINLNPQLFQYNTNKQAEIADLSAGTFSQLVRAAEACPARCIHPGAPQEGDPTATGDLIARAAKFA